VREKEVQQVKKIKGIERESGKDKKIMYLKIYTQQNSALFIYLY
jgi:hypothetical protein